MGVAAETLRRRHSWFRFDVNYELIRAVARHRTVSAELPRYCKNNLPVAGLGKYLKQVPVLAVRIDGPFEVITQQGLVRCEDGWLAIDSQGWPYSIARAEFEAIYREVPSGVEGFGLLKG